MLQQRFLITLFFFSLAVFLQNFPLFCTIFSSFFIFHLLFFYYKKILHLFHFFYCFSPSLTLIFAFFLWFHFWLRKFRPWPHASDRVQPAKTWPRKLTPEGTKTRTSHPKQVDGVLLFACVLVFCLYGCVIFFCLSVCCFLYISIHM